MSTHYPIATLVNVAAIIVGSLLGLLFQEILTEGIKTMLFQAIGLGTILIGVKMALQLPDGYMLIFIFSLILGAAASEYLKVAVGSGDSTFTEGLITAFLLFCIGSMTIVGALEEGLKGKRELLYIKSMLDGFSSIALAATFGVGVMFSVLPLLIFQGGITLGASRLQRFLQPQVVATMSAVGGVLILGISINMLQLGELNLENLLPSLFVAVFLSRSYLWYSAKGKKVDMAA